MNLNHPQSGISLPPGVGGELIGNVSFEIHCLMWKKEEFFDKHCEVQFKWWGDLKTNGSYFSPVTCSNQERHVVEKHLPKAKDVVLYKSIFPILTGVTNLYKYMSDLGTLRITVRVVHSEDDGPQYVGETFLIIKDLHQNKPIVKQWISVHDEEGLPVGSLLVSMAVEFEEGVVGEDEGKAKRIVTNKSAIFNTVKSPTVNREKIEHVELKTLEASANTAKKSMLRMPPSSKNRAGKRKRINRSTIKFRKSGQALPPAEISIGETSNKRDREDVYFDRLLSNATNLFNQMSDFEEEARNEVYNSTNYEDAQKEVFRDPTVFVDHAVRLDLSPDVSVDMENDLDHNFDDVDDDDERWVEERINSIMPTRDTAVTVVREKKHVETVVPEVSDIHKERKSRIRKEMGELKTEMHTMLEEKKITRQKAQRDVLKKKKKRKKKEEWVGDPRNLHKMAIFLTRGRVAQEQEGGIDVSVKVPISVEKNCKFAFKNIGVEMGALHALHIFDIYSDSPNFKNVTTFSCVVEVKRKGQFLGICTIPLSPIVEAFSGVSFMKQHPFEVHRGEAIVTTLEMDREIAILDISILLGKVEHVPVMEGVYFNSLERDAMFRKQAFENKKLTNVEGQEMPLEAIVVHDDNDDLGHVQSVLNVDIIRAAGLKQAIKTVSLKKKLGLNLACKTGVNSFVQFELPDEWRAKNFDEEDPFAANPDEIEDDIEKKPILFETDIVTRSFCPIWNYQREITFPLDESAYGKFEKDELLFHIFHRMPKSVHLRQKPSVVLLGVATIKLSPMLVCKGGVRKWATVHDPFTGSAVGAIEIKLSFDEATEQFLKIEENQDKIMEDIPQVFEEKEEGKLEMCKLGVFVEELSVPRKILREHVSLHTQQHNPVFSCHYFVQYHLLGKEKPVETRLYTSSSAVAKIPMHHTADTIHPIGPIFFNYLKNETIEFKLFVCIDEIKTDEQTERETGIYLGSCYVSLSPLLFKKIESNENLVWIGGEFTLINPNADDLSAGAMKMKVVCETISETAYDKLKRVKNEFDWMKDVEDDENEGREDRYGEDFVDERKRRSKFVPSDSLDGIKDFKTSLRKIRKEIELRMSLDADENREGPMKNEEEDEEEIIDDISAGRRFDALEEEFVPEKELMGEDNFGEGEFQVEESEQRKEPKEPKSSSKEIQTNENEQVLEELSLTKEIQTENNPINNLTVNVYSAIHLPEIINNSQVSEPSCSVSISMKSPSSMDLMEIASTPVVKESCSPTWNYRLKLPIFSQVEKLYFQVVHHVFGEEGEEKDNKIIGKCEVDLGVLFFGMDIDGWYQLFSDFPNVSCNLRVSVTPDTYYVGKSNELEVLPNVIYPETDVSSLVSETIVFPNQNNDDTTFEPVNVDMEDDGTDINNLKRKLSQTLLDLDEALMNISNSSMEAESTKEENSTVYEVRESPDYRQTSEELEPKIIFPTKKQEEPSVQFKGSEFNGMPSNFNKLKEEVMLEIRKEKYLAALEKNEEEDNQSLEIGDENSELLHDDLLEEKESNQSTTEHLEKFFSTIPGGISKELLLPKIRESVADENGDVQSLLEFPEIDNVSDNV